MAAAAAAAAAAAQGSKQRDGATQHAAGRSCSARSAGTAADVAWGGGCADGSARSAASTAVPAPAGHYFYRRPAPADPGPESVRGCGGWSLSAGRAPRRGQSARGPAGGEPDGSGIWTAGRAPASPHGPGPPRTPPTHVRRPS